MEEFFQKELNLDLDQQQKLITSTFFQKQLQMFKCIKNFLSKLIEEESALLSPPLCGDNKDISPLQSFNL